MGIDRYYQALPCDAELLRLAREDKDVAEDMLFPILLLGNPLESIPWLQEEKYAPLRSFCAQYPDLNKWHHSPCSRMRGAFALIAAINAENGLNPNESELEKTLGYQIVLGYEVFSTHFNSTVGIPVRMSSPKFVEDCATYCQLVDRCLIPEGLKEDFDNLVNFYKIIASHGNLSVFIMEN